MIAIIEKQTDEGNKTERIDNVGIIEHSKSYSPATRKWSEQLRIWTHSMYPHTIVTLDDKTQVVLKNG